VSRPAAWHAASAWTGDGTIARDALIEVEGERIVAVTTGQPHRPGVTRLRGLVMPGLANAHSHSFHRAMRGRAQGTGGDFWTWRDQMFAVAEVLDPASYRDLAAAVFAEMALAGITAVGEFHYLHHGPDGRPYDDPNAMGLALADAAQVAGIRLSLLDTCYLRSGFAGDPLGPAQRRFTDGHAASWAERASDLAVALAGRPRVKVGAAIHSVRAVDQVGMSIVAEWARSAETPLHFHLSEQRAENRAALAATGLTPTELFEAAGALGSQSTAVHATHLTGGDIARLGRTGTSVCLCPLTERDLADGIGPAIALASAGTPLVLGSDNHSQIDLFAEARAVEHHERLASGTRGHHDPDDLLRAATSAGMRSLGWDAGRLAPGALADFIAVDLESPRLAGAQPGQLASHVAFAATASDVTDVIVGGQPIVADRQHIGLGNVGGLLGSAIDSVGRAVA
jgi:formiminoglutamate deiminase